MFDEHSAAIGQADNNSASGLTIDSAPTQESESTPSVNEVSTSEDNSSHHQGIPQDDFNGIAAAIKKKYYAKGQRDAQKQYDGQQAPVAQSEYQQYSDAPPANVSQEQYQQPNDMAGLVQNEIAKLLDIAERSNNERQANQKAQSVAQQLQSKMTEASGRYSDYRNVLSNVKMFTDTPQILDLANTVDNAGDVLYHLAKSPNRIGNILALCQQSPHLATMAIREISGQINANKAGASASVVPDPVNPIRPSRVGTDDGKLGVRDYKNMFRV